MKRVRHIVAAASLLPGACATPGGGPFGFVMFDPNQHVAAAEPLFGQGDERCLDDPTFLLTVFAIRKETMPSDPNKVDVCTRIRWSLEWGLISDQAYVLPVATKPPPTEITVTLAHYDEQARNEVIGALVGASNRKCGRYIAFLQQYNGNVGAGFGIIGQTASALATVATGGLNKAFTVTSVIAGHARSEINEAYFANQTVGVLVQAFQNARATQAQTIANHLTNDPVPKYTLMQGLSDVFDYHASCSIVVGLEQAQQAVSAKAAPPTAEDIASQLTKSPQLRDAVDKILTAPPLPPPPQPPTTAVTNNSEE